MLLSKIDLPIISNESYIINFFENLIEIQKTRDTEYVTLMGYPHSINSEIKFEDPRYVKMYSNPNINTCINSLTNTNDLPCGVNKYSISKADAADASSAINLTFPQIADFRIREKDSPLITSSTKLNKTEYFIGSLLNDKYNEDEGNVDKIWSSTGNDIISLSNAIYFHVPELSTLEQTTLEFFTKEDKILINVDMITNLSNQLINEGNNLKIIFPEDVNKFILVKNVQKEDFIEEHNINQNYQDCYNSKDNGELCQVIYLELKLKPIKDSQEVVLGSNDNDSITGSEEKENISGGAGNDTIIGGYNSDTLNGGSGDDILGSKSTTSKDWLATELDDYYDEFLGSDYYGGTGNDSMYGSRYGDTYYFNSGDGIDHITDFTNLDRHSVTEDSMVFGEGILPEDLAISRDGIDVRIENTKTGDVIYVLQGLSQDDYQIEYFFFESSSNILTWENDILPKALDYKGTPNSETIQGLDNYPNTLSGLAGADRVYGRELDDTLYGNEGNDTLEGRYGYDYLYGNDGADILGDSSTSSQDFLGNDANYDIENNFGQYYIGGAGNDKMYGTRYGDTYLFNQNDGEDIIYEKSEISLDNENSHDTIIFEDSLFSDFDISRVLYDVTITHKETGDEILIDEGLKDIKHQIEKFDFIDLIKDWDDIQKEALILHGDDGYDNLKGLYEFENTLYAHGYNDSLYGGYISDKIYGGDGNDNIRGYYGYDYMYGEAGNDILGESSTSSKTYKGTLLPFDPENSYGNYYDGGTGNDKMYGSNYGDTYYFDINHGEDYVKDYSTFENTTSTIDTFVFSKNILPSQVVFNKVGSDLVITYNNGTEDSIEIDYFYTNTKNLIEVFKFETGTEWSGDKLLSKASTFKGTDGDGNDTIGSNSTSNKDYKGNDSSTIDSNINYGNYYEGGKGNDILEGSRYGDTYFFNIGDGNDIIKEISNSDVSIDTAKDIIEYGEGISPEHITIYRNSNDLFLENTVSGDTIEMERFFQVNNTYNYQIEFVKFKDGTLWNIDYLIEKGLILIGKEGDPYYLYGLDYFNDVIYGRVGFDSITGGSGNDILYGREGDDGIYGDEDNDILYGEEGEDKLDGGLGYDYLYGGSGNDTLGKTSGYDYYGFGGSTTPANTEESFGNYYDGGTGHDILNGSRYGDIYFFESGHGFDTITDKSIYSSDLVSTQDVIKFGSSITLLDLVFMFDRNDLVIVNINKHDRITIKNMYTNPEYNIESIVFSDGEIITYHEIIELAEAEGGFMRTQAFVSADELITVDGLSLSAYIPIYKVFLINETSKKIPFYWRKLEGKEGNDIIFGGEGYFEMDGGLGNDYLGYSSNLTCNQDNYKSNSKSTNNHYNGYITQAMSLPEIHYRSNLRIFTPDVYTRENGVLVKIGRKIYANQFLSKLYYISSGSDFICGSRYGDTYRVPASIEVETNPENINVTTISDTSEFIPTEEYDYDILEFLLLDSEITVEYLGEDVIINTIGGKIIIKDSKSNPLNRIEKFSFSSDGKTFNNFLTWDDIINKIQ
jgi:Ca2+-binding RTX toxin-like protein